MHMARKIEFSQSRVNHSWSQHPNGHPLSCACFGSSCNASLAPPELVLMVGHMLLGMEAVCCYFIFSAEAGLSVVQERVAQERQQPKLPDLTPEEEFSARLDHALSTLKLEVWSRPLGHTSHEHSCCTADAIPCRPTSATFLDWKVKLAYVSGCRWDNGSHPDLMASCSLFLQLS